MGIKVWPWGLPWCPIPVLSCPFFSQITSILTNLGFLIIYHSFFQSAINIPLFDVSRLCFPRSHPCLWVLWDVKTSPRLDSGPGISMLFQLLSWQLPTECFAHQDAIIPFPNAEFTNILSTPKIPPKIILKGTHQRGTLSEFPPK